MSRPADHSAYSIPLQQNKKSENLHNFFISRVYVVCARAKDAARPGQKTRYNIVENKDL